MQVHLYQLNLYQIHLINAEKKVEIFYVFLLTICFYLAIMQLKISKLNNQNKKRKYLYE